MGDPGFGAAGIGWVVNKLLDKVALALKDTVNLPKYCGQLNVYVLRIKPLVSAAEGSYSKSALPQGNGDIQVKEWLQEVKLVLEEADLLVAKCGALPAGKLNSLKHMAKRLKLSRQILTLTRRLKELASTESTWACLAKQVVVQDSVAAQGYLVQKILDGTEDNQVLVKEVRELLDKRAAGDGMDEAVKQLVEEFDRIEVQVSDMNQDLVHEMKIIQELRADMKQTGKVVTDICCRTDQVLDLSTQARDMMRMVWEEVTQVKLQNEELLRQLATSRVPKSLPLPSFDLGCSPSTSYSGDNGKLSGATRGRKRGPRTGLAVLISMEKGRPWVSVDRAMLELLAYGIGFEVKVIKNTTAAELISMTRNLETSSYREAVAECDPFVCFVIADVGTDGRVFIYDEHGDSVYVYEDIVRHFLLSPLLSCKSKVFILAGCRRLVKYLGEEKPDDQQHSALPRGLDDEVITWLPDFRDVLDESIISFTIPKAQFYLHGSPFVRALVEVWRQRHGDTDVQTIMSLVSRELCRMGEWSSWDNVCLSNIKPTLVPRIALDYSPPAMACEGGDSLHTMTSSSSAKARLSEVRSVWKPDLISGNTDEHAPMKKLCMPWQQVNR